MDKWRELYDWLGSEAGMKDDVANDLFTSDRLSLAYAQQADMLREVRDKMRTMDSSLPAQGVDNE